MNVNQRDEKDPKVLIMNKTFGFIMNVAEDAQTSFEPNTEASEGEVKELRAEYVTTVNANIVSFGAQDSLAGSEDLMKASMKHLADNGRDSLEWAQVGGKENSKTSVQMRRPTNGESDTRSARAYRAKTKFLFNGFRRWAVEEQTKWVIAALKGTKDPRYSELRDKLEITGEDPIKEYQKLQEFMRSNREISNQKLKELAAKPDKTRAEFDAINALRFCISQYSVKFTISEVFNVNLACKANVDPCLDSKILYGPKLKRNKINPNLYEAWLPNASITLFVRGLSDVQLYQGKFESMVVRPLLEDEAKVVTEVKEAGCDLNRNIMIIAARDVEHQYKLSQVKKTGFKNENKFAPAADLAVDTVKLTDWTGKAAANEAKSK